MTSLRPASTSHPLAQGSVIVDPEPCAQCGYNLQGLHRGGVCPECGRGITAAARGPRNRLLDAPRPYLLRLAATLMLMGWAGLAIFGLAALPAVITSLPVIRALPVATNTGIAAIFLGLAGTLVWASCAVLLCKSRPGVDEQTPEARRWARLTLLSQPLLPVALALAGAAMLTDAAALQFAAYFFGFVAVWGLLPTAMHLANFADWADDLTLAIKFRTAGWILAAGAIIDALYRAAALANLGIAIVIMIVWVFSTLLMLGGLFLLSWRCVQLASVVRWAMINSKDAEDRDARLAEKAERDRREREARIEAQQRAARDTPSDNAPSPGHRAARGERVIEQSDGGGYELENP